MLKFLRKYQLILLAVVLGAADGALVGTLLLS